MSSPSSQRLAQIADAVTTAFESRSLQLRVLHPLGIRMEDIVSSTLPYRDQVTHIVNWIDNAGLTEKFTKALYEANSGEELRRIHENATEADPERERLLQMGPARSILDAEHWRAALAQVERQVCVVRSEHGRWGTGFLVGPDQVMTHMAVIADTPGEVAGVLARESMTVAFDHSGGSRWSYRVVPAPLFAAGGAVVLRLDRAAGREASSEEATGSSASGRGWLAPTTTGAPDDRAVLIVHYVEKLGMRFAFDTGAVLRVRSDGMILLNSNIAPGGAGAPVLDASFRLMAVLAPDNSPSMVAAIPVRSIVDELSKRGLSWSATIGIHPNATDPIAPSGTEPLDAIVRSFAVDFTAADADDDVWSDDDGDASDPDRWAWAEAAAVTAYFDPAKLKPEGHPSPKARVAVLLESSAVRRRDGTSCWMLSEAVRRRALQRLAQRNALQRVREGNRDNAGELLDDALAALIAGEPLRRADLQEPDRLRAMLQAIGWLSRTGIEMPDSASLRATLERATLIAPFRHLTRGYFAGRETEIERLLAYVDGPDVDSSGEPVPPILLFGPGGMGKSALLAHFILAHSEKDAVQPDRWRPFIYLDFDRPELDARDRAGVLLALVRQIGSQATAVQEHAATILGSWAERRRDRRAKGMSFAGSPGSELAPRTTEPELDALVGEVADMLNAACAAAASPLLLVLDTVEEVQYATPDAVGPLAHLVIRLRKLVPKLRPILSGRLEIDPAAKLQPISLGPLPRTAAEALLGNNLPPALAARTDLVARMIKVVGGNPLSLRLAAGVLAAETERALAATEDETLWQRVGDAIVQGQLYERIVGHLHEDALKQLAIPGLVVRYLTPEIIWKVLAGPCGVEVQDDATAQSLFDSLSKEVALVRQGSDPGKLVLRPELRRTVLDSFRSDTRSLEKRRLIHQAAIAFFSPRPGVEERAEEIYHRLWLGQGAEEIDARWLAGVEVSLRSAVEELDGHARTYLASRVGGVDDAAMARTASSLEWETYAHKRASDLLRLDSAAAALDVLQLRQDRTPTSRLHLIESIARRSLRNPDLAGAEIAAEQAVLAARASGNPTELRLALQDLVQTRRLRGDAAGVLRALADLGNLGEQLGDDVILLGAEVEALEAVVLEPEADRFTETALRVFARLPDELVARAPELARRLAAQVGGDDPATLQRVIRLVGIGPLNAESAGRLRDVILAWEKTTPGIAAFVPRANATPQDVASAVQYLIGTRLPDPETAFRLSSWLQQNGTPASNQEPVPQTAAGGSSEQAPAESAGANAARGTRARQFYASVARTETAKQFLRLVMAARGLERLSDAGHDLGDVPERNRAQPQQAEAARDALQKIGSGDALTAGEQFALEAIIIPAERPSIDVVDGDYRIAHPIWAHLDAEPIKSRIRNAIPSVGRIELTGHPLLSYLGTGFVVGENLVMTNRHVAQIFALGLGDRDLAFQPGLAAAVDFKGERSSSDSLVANVVEVVMIHPHWDMALLRVEGLGPDQKPLVLSSRDPQDIVGQEVVTIGYPAFDLRNDVSLQNTVFDGAYSVKRLQPGRLQSRQPVMSFGQEVQAVAYDCATLGSNSGAAVIDIATGHVIALQFGTSYLEANFGVPASELARDQRVVAAKIRFDE